jgi:hypothetical protein
MKITFAYQKIAEWRMENPEASEEDKLKEQRKIAWDIFKPKKIGIGRVKIPFRWFEWFILEVRNLLRK